MKNHLLAVESGATRGRLTAPELADVVKSIKTLSTRARNKPRLELRGKTVAQMLEEAARHPEVAKAMAAMGMGG